MNESNPSHFHALLATVKTLRAPGGCPWDREQTHASLTECLVEECAELLEAIDHLDFPHMREELGDLLLNVVMQAEIASEAGHFDMEAVCAEINAKLIRRHPHVFGDASDREENASGVLKRWDAIKAAEAAQAGKTSASPFKVLPPQLPALLTAKKSWKMVEKAGLADACGSLASRVQATALALEADAIAEQLFVLSAACREKGLDPELLLRQFCRSTLDRLS
jgi:XTP/dITP diphosphohydrolase/tetrapyrrole methylase family protein/MazG family protein